MKRYSVAEARDHLPGIVHDVERGTAVEITRRGRPVTVVLSIREYERLSGKKPESKKRDFWEAYQEWRRNAALEGMDEAVDEILSYRDRFPGRDVHL